MKKNFFMALALCLTTYSIHSVPLYEYVYPYKKPVYPYKQPTQTKKPLSELELGAYSITDLSDASLLRILDVNSLPKEEKEAFKRAERRLGRKKVGRFWKDVDPYSEDLLKKTRENLKRIEVKEYLQKQGEDAMESIPELYMTFDEAQEQLEKITAEFEKSKKEWDEWDKEHGARMKENSERYRDIQKELKENAKKLDLERKEREKKEREKRQEYENILEDTPLLYQENGDTSLENSDTPLSDSSSDMFLDNSTASADTESLLQEIPPLKIEEL